MHLFPFQAKSNKVGPWKKIESSLKSPRLGLFLPKNVRKTCEIAIARRTHEKWPHARTSHTRFESLWHAHRTRANVRARVRVRIQFRNSQIGF